MLKRKFFGKTAKNEKGYYIAHDDGPAFMMYLEQWPLGKEVEYTVAPKYKKRTSGKPDEDTNFNGYFWGVQIQKYIAAELGEMNLKAVANWILIQVGHCIEIKGQMIPLSTADLSGGEFAELTSKIRMWCSVPGNLCEAGLYIPEPHEVEFKEYDV